MEINLTTKIGPSGNSERFYAEGNKHTFEAPKWLFGQGLNAFEYSFGRGINLSDDTARLIGEECKKYGVEISVHAPYYINLANENPEMAKKSIGYIIDSAKAVRKLGGKRVIFHPAGQGKLSREKAFSLTMARTEELLEEIAREGLTDVLFCPETMGKLRQIGDLTEIVTMCRLSELLLPCIDFGHLNARTFGSLKTVEDNLAVLDEITNGIGERGKNIHIHFSKIMYGAGGEVKHLTFDDTEYGPEFAPLAKALKMRGFAPVIICESDGTQSDDAKQIAEILSKTV